MIKGIIFDMDGVIIDSNHIHYENWNSVFEKRFSVTIPKDEFASRLGESAKHFTEYFINRFKLNVTFEELSAELIGAYRDNSHKIILKAGIKEALPRLKDKYRIALATGANKEMAMHTVATFEIADYFDFIIAGNEVKRAKPDPEIFLKAAEVIGLKPEECVVIEDAYLGIKAAKAAGMKVISIPDELTKYQDHRIADLRLSSISQLTEDVLDRL
jgi:HAD superfamily hydrolase (TIGR01509 family)